MRSRVSVIATIRDELDSIEPFLTSILEQSLPADEIVLVDGGSTDGTLDVLEGVRARDPRVHVYRCPGTSISEGRNIAIAKATSPIIAVTDAGTILEPDWLEHLVTPFWTNASLAVSAGFFRPGGDRFFERCLTTVITPQHPEINPGTFMPSSRSVAFRREWWEWARGYPEWLQHCEDLVFDLTLARAGAPFLFVPEAVVTWRAPPTPRSFFRQYFNYARGDGHAHLWLKRHLVRYSAYVVGATLLIAGLGHPGYWLALLAGMAVYFSKFYRRLWRIPPARTWAQAVAAAALVPVIVVTGDVAKMIGYPVGLYQRARAGGPEGLARRFTRRHEGEPEMGLP